MSSEEVKAALRIARERLGSLLDGGVYSVNVWDLYASSAMVCMALAAVAGKGSYALPEEPNFGKRVGAVADAMMAERARRGIK